ncbi:hypothetical protein Gohar_026681, partial [Gossypium harknessii]|nr:hypothetical protein [Gossypium harknessii]
MKWRMLIMLLEIVVQREIFSFRLSHPKSRPFSLQVVLWSAEEIVKNTYSWAKQYLADCTGGSVRQVSIVATMEAEKWIRLRLDRVVKLIIGCAVVGGIVRDHNGNWIIDFLHDKVYVQTDNMEVIRAIKDSLSKSSNLAIIRRR